MATRPGCIVHWRDIQETDEPHYEADDEKLAISSRFGRHFGLTRLGINHVLMAPGRRTSFPHAESTEEEFVFVIEGTPDVWLDGAVHRLAPGDGVGFVPGTGLAHTFLNNTDQDVRLLVVGDTPRADNRVYYPRNPDRQALRTDWWGDVPARDMGPHDGLTDAKRREARNNQPPE